jgi:hypothetical protein
MSMHPQYAKLYHFTAGLSFVFSAFCLAVFLAMVYVPLLVGGWLFVGLIVCAVALLPLTLFLMFYFLVVARDSVRTIHAVLQFGLASLFYCLILLSLLGYI